MLNIIEEWKGIPIVAGTYEVSNLGRIRNKQGKCLKPYTINSGYQAIKLKFNGVRYHKLLHRLLVSSSSSINARD